MADTAIAFPSSLLQRVTGRLADWAIATAALALLGLVVVQGWQVIARYVLNDSPSWTEPVTLLLLSTAMSLGAAAGVHTRRHFAFSLLAEALKPRARHAMHLLQSAVIVLIGLVLLYWGAVLFIDGVHIPTAGAPMPESIEYLPLAVSGALMALFALAQMIASPDAPAAPEAD
ncbi:MULTISPECIES: TRAP transporter small permease [unclassified Lysobacter]|uniref:TRAP transporter small permease n=1 Tax=unclassified Lysobacter TaxID=2635362 RepID=UPI001C2425EB|nr:TRAP transporter small permease [Lysobacter sp. MMG2]MBU8975997.1 TRAP transporter small permease [Lysobacter sp. MMG2]